MTIPDRPAHAAHTDSYARAIVSGGDERLTLNSTGENRYFVNPLVSSGYLNRGSCTCSPLTTDGDYAARDLWQRLTRRDTSFANARARQAERIRQLYDPFGTHDMSVVFAPSGSDLCYLPLLFASQLNPGRTLHNIVVCCEELGSGSLLAHDGRFYARQSQIAADLPGVNPSRDNWTFAIIHSPPAVRTAAFSTTSGKYGGLLKVIGTASSSRTW